MTKLGSGHKSLYHIVIYRHLTYKCELGLGGYDLGVERDTSFNYGGHLICAMLNEIRLINDEVMPRIRNTISYCHIWTVDL